MFMQVYKVGSMNASLCLLVLVTKYTDSIGDRNVL